MARETHAQRRDNARSWAVRVNRAVTLGLLVRWRDEWIGHPLIVTETEILLRYPPEQDGCTASIQVFENNPAYDHGLYETIDQWNQRNVVRIYRLVPDEEMAALERQLTEGGNDGGSGVDNG